MSRAIIMVRPEMSMRAIHGLLRNIRASKAICMWSTPANICWAIWP